MTDPALWLARASGNPGNVLATWTTAEAIELPVGIKWDAVEVELDLASRAVGELEARKEHVGARLISGADQCVWWLLPLGSGLLFDAVPDVVVREPGWLLSAPMPGSYRADRVWVLPEDIRQLTEPTALRDALQAAMRAWHAPGGATANELA